MNIWRKKNYLFEHNVRGSNPHLVPHYLASALDKADIQLDISLNYFVFWDYVLLFLHHQDVQWNDLDYADKSRVFTFDPWRFGDLPEMVEEFHARGMKYILILVWHLKLEKTSQTVDADLTISKYLRI